MLLTKSNNPIRSLLKIVLVMRRIDYDFNHIESGVVSKDLRDIL